ncbi:MAG: type ISP restriction/modification enzyme [Alkalispirochaeta sp.]
MSTDHRGKLAQIKRFDQLVGYLRNEMGWPIDNGHDFEDVTFEYTPEELGIDPKNAAKIQEIKRLRPFSTLQPWGIFFIKFEPKRLPVVALRRILGQVALKKRASANSSERQAWAADDLLFISNYGDGDERRIALAHFAKPSDGADLPTLKVLGWDNLDTSLHLDAVAQELTEHLSWPSDESNIDAWRDQWRSAFMLRHREVINTSKQLSERLAELARAIRDRIRTVLDIETETGPLTKLLDAFRSALVHDLDEAGFADMYAQTIAYGLLSARITDPQKRTADDFAAHMRTNPFLKELMETFLHAGGRRGKAGGAGIDFDELGVSEVVALLDHANMEAVVRDFGDRNPQEDPVIHFYEHFLAAYDKKQKVSRGVFYTPRPVVSYIVRSVDDLLRTEFGLEDGLADTATWGDMKNRVENLEIPDGTSLDQDFVQILDPATGTGTFLVEVIDTVHKTLVAKWKAEGQGDKKIDELWNRYVPKHLLTRLHGYELLMAPYAIAHLKVGLKLYETGYRFESDERARVYLTNALESAQDKIGRFEFAIPALAHEAIAVNEVKLHKNFTVVIGNPPYSYMSANMNETSRALVEPFRYVDGIRIVERGALVLERGLQDDYIKFFALTFQLLNMSGIGLVSMISNSAYLNSPHHRGLRWYIRQTFSRYRALDLHGDIKSGGDEDHNVFDIKTGVAIGLGEILPGSSVFTCTTASLSGSRARKEAALNARTLLSDCQRFFAPEPEQYLFDPEIGNSGHYGNWFSIADVFRLTSVGIKTNRDNLVIGFNDQEIETRIRTLIDPMRTTEQVKSELSIADNAQWKVVAARKKCRDSYSREHFRTLDYRPFDQRRIYYHPSVVFNPRPAVMAPLLTPGNLALLTNRRIRTDVHSHFFVSSRICMAELLSSADNCNVYPLWNVEDQLFAERGRRPNIAPDFLKALSASLELPQEGSYGVPAGLTPENIFHYVYAVFYSPGYRSRYARFLKIDFPRLPLTRNLDLFRALVQLGEELTALHLLDSPKLDHFITEFIGSDNSEVEKVSWTNNTVWLDKTQTTGFKGVCEQVWSFRIGTYQVCHKWLKDRKGRTLSDDDIAHYQKIVVALSETIRIMGEIDEVIEAHGGWPGAFLTGAESEENELQFPDAAEQEPSYSASDTKESDE